MSILSQQPQTPQAIAQQKANAIKESTARASRRLIREWERNIDLLWDAEDTQAILTALGTDAAEVFQLSSATIQLMMTILPERVPEEAARLQSKLLKIRPHTIHPTGAVTLK